MTGGLRPVLRVVVVLAAILTAVAQAQGTNRSSGLKLHIESPKDHFIVKEQILLKIRIENTGPTPVSVPNITDNRNVALSYDLTGPSVASAHRFTYGAAGARLPGDAEAVLLQPGQSTEAKLNLTHQLSVWKEGMHALRLHLAEVVSAPFAFTLDRPTVRSAQVFNDGAESLPGQIRLAFLDGHNQVYLGFFDEPDGVGEGRPESSFLPVANVPADTHSLLMPTSNFNRSALFFSRYGWRSWAAVGADDAPTAGRVQLDLAGAHALRPSLLQRSGDIDVFLMEATRLTLARLPRQGRDTSRRLWNVVLPGRAVSGSAASGSLSAGSPQAAVVVCTEATGLAVALVQDEIELMLQVNGKLRGAIVVPAGASRVEIELAAIESDIFRKIADGAAPKKVIVVPGRLVNLVV